MVVGSLLSLLVLSVDARLVSEESVVSTRPLEASVQAKQDLYKYFLSFLLGLVPEVSPDRSEPGAASPLRLGTARASG